jgi:hypothetical protein
MDVFSVVQNSGMAAHPQFSKGGGASGGDVDDNGSGNGGVWDSRVHWAADPLRVPLSIGVMGTGIFFQDLFPCGPNYRTSFSPSSSNSSSSSTAGNGINGNTGGNTGVGYGYSGVWGDVSSTQGSSSPPSDMFSSGLFVGCLDPDVVFPIFVVLVRITNKMH